MSPSIGIGLGLSLRGGGGGGASALPTPYASWDGNLGNASRGAVANSVSAQALPNNILRTVNGMDISDFFSANGATLTDFSGYQRGVSTNTTGLVQMLSVRLVAGTYTMSFDAKSNDGVSTYSTFMGPSTAPTTISVTPTEQTFSKTFVVAATGNVTLYWLYRNTSGDAYDIVFRNVRLHAGASDLGVDTHAAHMMFGKSDADTANPTFSDKTLDRQYGVARLASPISVSAFTMVATINQAGNTTGTPAPILCGDLWTSFEFGSKNNTIHGRIAAGTMDSEYGRLKQSGWIVVAIRVSASLQELFVNGALVYRGTASFSPYTLSILGIGTLGNLPAVAQLPSGDKLQTVQFYNSALSDDDLAAVIADLKLRLVTAGLSAKVLKYSYHAGGDSLTFDSSKVGATGVGSYARRWFTTNTTAIGEVFAVSSTGIADLTTRVNNRLSMWERAIASGTTPIVSIMTGVNDTVDVGTWLPQYLANCDAIRAIGAKVLAIPVPPRSLAGVPQNTGRIAVNDAMAAATTRWDGFADLRANAAYDAAAPAGGVYYEVDQVHWNGAGYDEITPTIHTALQTLVDAIP